MVKMIKRMLVACMALAFALFGAAPALANPQFSTATRCHDIGPSTVCAHIEWSNQADGDGVVLNRVASYAGNPGAFNSPCFKGATIFWYPNTGWVGGSYTNYFNYGDEDCNWSHSSIDWRGRDVGGMLVELHEHANLDWYGDQCVIFKWEIFGGGSSNYLGASHSGC